MNIKGSRIVWAVSDQSGNTELYRFRYGCLNILYKVLEFNVCAIKPLKVLLGFITQSLEGLTVDARLE